MSHKYRIGNNLEIQWTVNLHRSDGTLVDLTSLNLGVQLIVGQKLYEVQNPTIAANLITFLYPGADQHYDGPYVVKLYDKDNTTITYDVRNAFILTDSSWTADSVYVPEDITVEIETDINAVQIVAIAGPKGDKGDKGDTGSKGDTGENGADGANGYDGVDGKDGADGKDGQDGRNGVDGKDGEPGRSIRKSVFEVGKMYYNGEVLSDDGVYYLDIVTDTAVAMADEEVNYYVCKETHLSTANEDLDDTTLWTPMSEMDPIVTPLVLAQQIDAEFIDVDSLVAKKVTVTDSGNNVIAKIGDMNNYVVEEQTKKYPFWIGGATPAEAVTRIDSTGELETSNIKASGGEITGALKLGEDGKFQSSGYVWATGHSIELNNQGLIVKSENSVHGSHKNHVEIYDSFIEVLNDFGGYSSSPARKERMTINDESIYYDDLLNNKREYAVFANDAYKLCVASALPASPDSNTIYLVTGSTGQGVYVGSTKIA